LRKVKVSYGIKNLSTDCELQVSASTKAEEFVAITLRNSSKVVTLKLKGSAGEITKTVRGSSAYETTTYQTRTSALSVTTYEDIADASISLHVGEQQIDCRFEE